MSDLISRQAAFIALNKRAENVSLKTRIGLLDAVRVIDELPSVEPERCRDCISRRAIIGKCEDTAKATSESGEINTGFIIALDFIADYAKHLPSVEPERKPGKWLLKIEDWNRWTCSECGFSKRTDIHVTLGYDYCPKCGAPMEVDG